MAKARKEAEMTFGKTLSLQMKLARHIKKGDHRRVRDYMLQVTKVWTLKNCPLDPKILKQAHDLLRQSGYKIGPDPKRGVVYTSPNNGKSYGSFETKLDPIMKPFLAD